MRTEWTAKGNRDAGPSCSCDRGLHWYLRNFFWGGRGVWTPETTPSVRHWLWVLCVVR